MVYVLFNSLAVLFQMHRENLVYKHGDFSIIVWIKIEVFISVAFYLLPPPSPNDKLYIYYYFYIFPF